MPSEPPPGRIVLVGTPIGNLGDLAPRAVECLAGADVICCEDTRRTRALLSAAGVPAPRLVALHQHNEATAAAQAVEWAADGAVVAVVTDAGMPGISDPGQRVADAALSAGVTVSVVPGPSAAVTALALSGLAAERWCFEGFLPRKGGARTARLAGLAAEARPTVLYEAPHRVGRTLDDLVAVCGTERVVVAARELTKLHEEIWRATLGEAVERCRAVEPRGEWVLVVDGAPEREVTDADIGAGLEREARSGVVGKAAVAAVAEALGAPRRRVYDLDLVRRKAGGGPDGDR